MMPDLQQINLADLRPKARLIPAEVIQVACQKRPGAVLFQQRQHGIIIFRKRIVKSPNGNACVGISETISAPRAFSACTI